MRYETGLRRGRLAHENFSKCQPISKRKKSKMARNSGCSRFHLFDMFPFALQTSTSSHIIAMRHCPSAPRVVAAVARRRAAACLRC